MLCRNRASFIAFLASREVTHRDEPRSYPCIIIVDSHDCEYWIVCKTDFQEGGLYPEWL